jgi:hypothetical protein
VFREVVLSFRRIPLKLHPECSYVAGVAASFARCSLYAARVAWIC